MKAKEMSRLGAAESSESRLAVRDAIPVVGPAVVPPDAFSLRDILAVFRAHLPLFLGTVLTILGIGLVLALVIPPSYESTAVINLEDRSSFFDTDKMLGGEVPGISRDTSVLQSMPLAIRVLGRLKEEKRLPAVKGTKMGAIPAALIKNFRNNLRVEHTPGSSVYAISYRDTDPELAARIVNLVVEEFRKLKSELLAKRYNMVRGSINQETERLREEVRKAEQKVADYKQAHGLSDNIGISLKIRQVSDLNSELRQAKTDLREMESKWKQISSLTRGGNTAAIATVVNSVLVQSLRDKQVALKAKIRELEQEYGARHPIMADARAQLEEVNKSIRRELDFLIENTRNDLQSQQKKVQLLAADIQQREEEILRAQTALVRLGDMERDVASSRRVLEQFLVAEKQHGISARNEIVLSNPITVISRGFVPVESVFPSPRHILVLFALAAPILGTMFVFFAEHLNPRLPRRRLVEAQRSTDDVAQDQQPVEQLSNQSEAVEEVRYIDDAAPQSPPEELSVPIPGDGFTIVPATEMVTKMQSRFSAAISRLNEVLMARIGASEPKVILVTSVGRKGDKVSIASALAAVNAQAGKKVIVVDLSMGEAELHRAFALEPSPGMSEVMDKKLALLKAFQTDFRTHVSLFTRGSMVSDGQSSKVIDAAPALFTLLKRYFDQIYVVVRDINVAGKEELFRNDADQIVLVVEQTGNEHVKLTSMLLKSTLADVSNKVTPVYVRRENG